MPTLSPGDELNDLGRPSGATSEALDGELVGLSQTLLILLQIGGARLRTNPVARALVPGSKAARPALGRSEMDGRQAQCFDRLWWRSAGGLRAGLYLGAAPDTRWPTHVIGHALRRCRVYASAVRRDTDEGTGQRLRVLGVNATAGKLWLCLVDDNGPQETEPGLLELRAGIQAGYAIKAFQDECNHMLTALSPDHIVILDMETGGRNLKIADMRSRFAAETLLAVCAADMGLTCVRLARATLRSRLAIPRTGALANHVDSIFSAPVGTNWKKKRDLAALAAHAETI
jgi:hypothetical protein